MNTKCFLVVSIAMHKIINFIVTEAIIPSLYLETCPNFTGCIFNSAIKARKGIEKPRISRFQSKLYESFIFFCFGVGKES